MAANDAVWGIDIGQCALKALRCRAGDDKGRVVADAFDYVEYPTILGQPDADAETIVRDALKTFLSRNSVKNDRVAISVAGDKGLARFIKLPPVEKKKVPEIVKYEARQQIPFKLEEVIWAYQELPGGGEAEGFALESEVGLFAMKRDLVFKAIKPLEEVGIEVDYIQLSPLAVFNFTIFDQIPPVSAKNFDPDSPPPSTVILSVGTEATDCVVTNGLRVWQRSIPLGGNHFTRALTKQLKLTFAKAEHLKKNINAAGEDAKAIIKALRPVLQDLLTEVQTSVRYFQMNVDKNANLTQVVALGNAMKLSGLRSFLSQGLDLPVVKLDAYAKLDGPSVVNAPAFKDNLLSFAGSYGLALQGLDRALLRTNLLPPEVNQQRMIRDKKPWAIAGAATLLVGFSLNYMAGHWRPLLSAKETQEHRDADRVATDAAALSSTLTSEWDKIQKDHENLTAVAKNLRELTEGPRHVPEMLAAVAAALPRQPENDLFPEDVTKRVDLQIQHVLWKRLADRKLWKAGAEKTADASAEGTEEAASPEAEEGAEEDASKGGYVVEIKGLHYHNGTGYPPGDQGEEYVKKTLVKNLETMSIMLPDEKGAPQSVPIAKLGITAARVLPSPPQAETPNPAAGVVDKAKPTLPTQEFTVQFWWEPKSLTERNAPDVPKADGDTVASTTPSE